MKKLLLTFALAGLVLTACKNTGGHEPEVPQEPQDLKISAASIEDTADVKNVKVIAGYGENKEIEIASAPLADGKFEITLPGTLTDLSALEPVTSFGEELTYSNPNAKTFNTDFFGYDASGERVVSLLNLAQIGKLSNSIAYVYSDSAVKITGSNTETKDDGTDGQTFIYNVNLVKGWNRILIVHDMEAATVTYTTPVPAGTSIPWIKGIDIR